MAALEGRFRQRRFSLDPPHLVVRLMISVTRQPFLLEITPMMCSLPQLVTAGQA